MNFLAKILKNSSLSLMSVVFSGLIIAGSAYFYMFIHLADVAQLKDMSMQLPLRVYTSDGKLINEFGEKKRIPVTLDQVPKRLLQAILDTEDQRFYEHRGVDFWSLLRATVTFIETGKKTRGASTITMQVARNFFLNRRKTIMRKLNEILLAFKIDNTFTKEEILELYLNKIYFGNRAYGVASAAQVYYGKTLSELTLPEMAMLAGLPQAPSRDNPIVNPEVARNRRNHVLQRMLGCEHVSPKEYEAAIVAPVRTNYHELPVEIRAPYVAEMVRSAMLEKYGDAVYDMGIKVYTTVDSHIQSIANKVLGEGILAYDKRHGYRGPEGHLLSTPRESWRKKLQAITTFGQLQPAAVINKNLHGLTVLLADGETVQLPSETFSWTATEFSVGDIVRVYKNSNEQWQFAQVPEVEGTLIVVNPTNGAILALNGGFSYSKSNYNRAIQAERQSGSVFKPFIYSAALAKDFTLASVVNDAPIVLENHATNQLWRPQNVSRNFLGPTRLREALMRSVNLVSIRLLQSIGIPYAVNYLKNFGFSGSREVPPTLSLALGSGSVTPLKMTSGYAVFANGGYQITPFVIKTIVEHDKVIWQETPLTVPTPANDTTIDKLPEAPRVITAQNAYLITDVLKDVVKRLAARFGKDLQRDDLGGKTGTTNEQMDAWFIGYNRNLVVTVWLGFDSPKSTHEYGAQAALPIWLRFMQQALKDKPSSNLPRPDDITLVRIDPATGLLAAPEQQNAIFEMFTTDTVPQNVAPDVPAENINSDEETYATEQDTIF